MFVLVSANSILILANFAKFFAGFAVGNSDYLLRISFAAAFGGADCRGAR
jgi:hypothetical protein